ncbi:AAA family ATPase [Deinococcus sp. QL22]|uniref:AAA family ATPase n=1 Tax=Deinococcus sp. QL22 TaxID=2939437 RepID=UPI002017AD24|nr:AAA family ATPase [Deinococcus sp. QL22]UQN10340.1 AAA family ATPase [Deinococcus sp. QL22]UQN10474.1 AAA family ATPase [Deinococcus sp. QL22]
MQFESVTMLDFPPFKDFSLNLPEGLTVIAGTNGVGKSRLLAFLSQQRPTSRHNINWPGVSLRGNLADGKVINFDVNRALSATVISSLRPYDHRYQAETAVVDQTNFSNVGRVFKNWFVHMDHFEMRGWIEDPNSASNFNLCKQIFSLLDPTYRFLEVNRNFEVLLETPAGPLPYDRTSSGFQSAYLLLFGIVFGIDFYSQGQQSAEEFEGCILIDEIDVHLHPAWQNRILGLIQEIVPRAQIIATTHSPHIIQGLSEHQLVVLETNTKGVPHIKEISPRPSAYGFQGWSIEEILRDVMGIEDTLSQERQRIEQAFNDALDSDDLAAAQAPYEQLMTMLHPTNPLRRVYDMQYRAMGGVSV